MVFAGVYITRFEACSEHLDQGIEQGKQRRTEHGCMAGARCPITEICPSAEQQYIEVSVRPLAAVNRTSGACPRNTNIAGPKQRSWTETPSVQSGPNRAIDIELRWREDTGSHSRRLKLCDGSNARRPSVLVVNAVKELRLVLDRNFRYSCAARSWPVLPAVRPGVARPKPARNKFISSLSFTSAPAELLWGSPSHFEKRALTSTIP